MRKRWIVAAVALLAALIVGATAANAATLGVTTKKEVTLTKLQRCAASMNGTTPVVKTTPASGTTITLTALPAACAGLSLTRPCPIAIVTYCSHVLPGSYVSGKGAGSSSTPVGSPKPKRRETSKKRSKSSRSRVSFWTVWK